MFLLLLYFKTSETPFRFPGRRHGYKIAEAFPIWLLLYLAYATCTFLVITGAHKLPSSAMVTVMGGLVLCNNTGETRRWTSGDLQCYSYFNHRRSACLKFEPELFPSITDEAIANASALVGDRNGIFHCRCSKLRWRSAPPWEENDALGDCDIMTPGIVLWNAGFVINSMLLATLIVLGFGLARRVQARTKRCWCRR